MLIKHYVADFETTTKEDDCRVWGWGVCDIEYINDEDIELGTTIDGFMHYWEKLSLNPKVYFHKLKFDGQFILYWLLKNGFKHVQDPKERDTKTFTTLISDKGLYYAIEVIYYRKGKKINKVTFQDSLKLIPLSVEDIAGAFKLPIKKLIIDYDAHNDLPEGSPMTDKEKDYLRNDLKIVAYGIKYFLDSGLDRMTIGSCALSEYKSLLGKKVFKRNFPVPKYHLDVKQSYRGGFTYLNPLFAGKILGNGVVLDVNSLYPDVMYNCMLPWGTPIFFNGKYKKDAIYPLYTQMIRCQFELKPGKIPTIQIKNSMFFKGNEYLTSSNDEEVTLCLNSVDLELFFENYDVYNIEYISGWKFRGTTGLFKEYIDKWNGIKIKSKEEKNWGMYLIAKLMLNALYGKFGTDVVIKSKIPYLDPELDRICYKDAEPEERDGIYIAMASFITSYARRKTITAAQSIMDDYEAGKSKIQFVYADTDSLHCISEDFSIPTCLDVDSSRLGAWKFESKFRRAKFIRQKCYIEDSTEDVYNEDPEYKLKITVAGMPDSCYGQVNFRNFKAGATYKGKLQPKIVKGGTILQNVDFTIKM